MLPPEQLKDRIAIYQYPKIETYLTGNVKIRLWCRVSEIKSVPSGSFFQVCHMLRHQWMCTLSLCLNVGVFSPNCWDIVATWNYSLGHLYHLSRQGDLRALIVFEFCNIVKWLRHSDICPFFFLSETNCSNVTFLVAGPELGLLNEVPYTQCCYKCFLNDHCI